MKNDVMVRNNHKRIDTVLERAKNVNKLAKVDSIDLRSRKRVRDNEERIDAVLERAEKIARSK